MVTTGWTEEDYQALAAHIATGVLEVQYHDRRVRYASLDQMRRLLGVMRVELDSARKPRVIYARIPPKGE